MALLYFQTDDGKRHQIKTEKGEDLIPALDKFLKKNKISITRIRNWFLRENQEKSIISQRIAQAILKALKISREWR